MNNKEAIVWLKNIIDTFNGNCTTDTLVPISRCDVKALDLAIKALENEPKKGKWLRITKNTEYIQMWNCSECGRTVEKATVLDPDIFFPFCHCGADMREGDEK